MGTGLEIGATLGGYKILARLRAGAMGVLYLGRRVGPAGFARPVAIKVIHEHLAQNRRFARMFIEEAKLSARIDDPHVVRVEEFGEEAGRYFLVMEYVHGVSLAQVLGVLRKRGGIPPDIAVAIAMQMTAGLHGAHEATDEEGAPLGIVHRDVSPHNVLVSYKGHVRIIDFGIAKARQQTGGNTQTGSLRGKLAYMPPEQARSAKTVDRRADLYAVGLCLWEMLVGKRMLDAPNELALLNLIKNPPIVPPSAHGADVPKELDAVVLACLAQEPSGRPANGNELQRRLAQAYPAARNVLPSDIAALMTTVRTAATSSGKEDDDTDTDLYGDEVKKTLTIFGRSMHESVELANDALDAIPKDRPSSGELVDQPSVIIEGHDEDDFRATARMPAPPVARHVAAQRTLKMPDAPRPTPLPLVTPRGAEKPPFAVVAAIGALICSSIVLVILIVRDHERQRELERILTASASARALATSPTPPTDPPPPTPTPDEPPPPAAVLTVTTATVATPDRAPPAPHGTAALTKARDAALAGNSSEVRRLLETRVRSGHGTTEEAALLRAACRAMKDTACREDIDRKYPVIPDPNMPQHL